VTLEDLDREDPSCGDHASTAKTTLLPARRRFDRRNEEGPWIHRRLFSPGQSGQLASRK